MSQDQQACKIAHLLVSQGADRRVFTGPFDAMISTQVMVVAIGAVLAVTFVVFFRVADQVGEGEAIVTGDKVDAVVGSPAVILVEVRAAGQAGRQYRDHGQVTTNETPQIIAELTVPFGPAPEVWKSADLVKSSSVPGFRDQFGVGQYRVAGNALQQRRVG